MASTSTVTLLNTIEWAKRFAFNRPSAIGNSLQPSMTNANTVLQTILGAPFAWRWNRVTTGFITTKGQQDYLLFNWTVATAIQVGWVTVDPNGNSQRCSVAGTTGTTPPTFATLKGATTTDGTATWSCLGSITVPVSQTYDFDWIETVALKATNPNTPNTPEWKEISPKICLGLDSSQARPKNISAQGDDGNGNITFRLMPVPDQAYPVAITMQQKPPVLTSVNQTWAPIPDEYSRLYNWGFLSLMLLFADDPQRFQMANQKFITSILSVNGGLTQTERNIWLNNWQAITGNMAIKDDTINQTIQARGV